MHARALALASTPHPHSCRMQPGLSALPDACAALVAAAPALPTLGAVVRALAQGALEQGAASRLWTTLSLRGPGELQLEILADGDGLGLEALVGLAAGGSASPDQRAIVVAHHPPASPPSLFPAACISMSQELPRGL